MIVSRARGDVAVRTGGRSAHWQSLIRRGMLHSECEGVEYWDLPPGGVLEVRSDHGVEEAVLVLDGHLGLYEDGAETARAGAGDVLLVPHGIDGELRAGDRPTTAVTVRGLPAAVSARLPRRIPELPPAG
ncbi:cupin domain-containing protein [Streptomyces sp. NPDC088090]|uniref:cupin domain-containing protein n=1 Tax=Streptomyces sp. NPDC088090 TaxID=3365822 RepID=UPI00384DEFA8